MLPVTVTDCVLVEGAALLSVTDTVTVFAPPVDAKALLCDLPIATLS